MWSPCMASDFWFNDFQMIKTRRGLWCNFKQMMTVFKLAQWCSFLFMHLFVRVFQFFLFSFENLTPIVLLVLLFTFAERNVIFALSFLHPSSELRWHVSFMLKEVTCNSTSAERHLMCSDNVPAYFFSVPSTWPRCGCNTASTRPYDRARFWCFLPAYRVRRNVLLPNHRSIVYYTLLLINLH